jgi:hypothetical protein
MPVKRTLPGLIKETILNPLRQASNRCPLVTTSVYNLRFTSIHLLNRDIGISRQSKTFLSPTFPACVLFLYFFELQL